eukprot:CAMPEP_0172508972 /NCGR_PEP_ID=MMETSP1066-20121228/216518_1 /TAXON_ID=671091 /ORGANISM="Coscinodiscus wailesii, Strain CCMP2513" /LENGTH=363 /DNA_ID=CAMNT_0013287233 /DNA_START=36 /DNA_END=1123 /DNA_ORIENTATION=-
MKILHLVGSQASTYYFGVSMMYAPGCINNFPEHDHIILLAHVDGTWSVCESLDECTPKKLSLPEALKILHEDSAISCMQPHMYDYKGMVSFRSIAELLDIPMIGNPGEVMALTTNKWQSRAVVESCGVPVPKAQLLREGDDVKLKPPFMIKPCREDNSMGITLVQEESQIADALKTGFTFDDELLCEQFIPLGKELRVGVVEKEDGELEFLPIMEYFLHNKELPIRTSKDKISSSDGKAGDMDFAPTDRQTPATIDDELKKKLIDLAIKSHKSLCCRHYSLYDVRVDPDGNPYFIEASPYCSFSPKSAIVCMSRGDEKYGDKDLFNRLANMAVREHEHIRASRKSEDGKQVLGMRSLPSLKVV